MSNQWSHSRLPPLVENASPETLRSLGIARIVVIIRNAPPKPNKEYR